MRTEVVDPRYGLNPNEAYWIYGDEDVMAMMQALDRGQTNVIKRILMERRFPLGWESNK